MKRKTPVITRRGGGSQLLQSFIDSGLWDEICVEYSGVVLQKGVKTPVVPAGYGHLEVLSRR